jgi:SAM-dependent methyltransferase
MRDLLRQAILSASQRARAKRGELFRRLLQPSPQDKILDLGGGDGSHIASILPGYHNIWVADIMAEPLQKAAQRGFHTVLLSEGKPLPFEDQEFDIVFCSSVIEHVTIPKSEIYSCRSGREFRQRAFAAQQTFAREIRRIGKRYFVQTPYKYFIIESHTWMPVCLLLLPRPLLIRFINLINKFWIKSTAPDWNLLTVREMRTLFPDAEIVVEWWFGLPKSLIACKR